MAKLLVRIEPVAFVLSARIHDGWLLRHLVVLSSYGIDDPT